MLSYRNLTLWSINVLTFFFSIPHSSNDNFASVAGGMDFRAMLMRKKKPAKKVVVVSLLVVVAVRGHVPTPPAHFDSVYN